MRLESLPKILIQHFVQFSEVFKEIPSNEQKLTMIASKWRELSEDDRKKWQDEARTVGKADPKTMSNDERIKIIKKEKKHLLQEVSIIKLASYICERKRRSYILIVSNSWGFLNIISDEGCMHACWHIFLIVNSFSKWDL